MVWFLSACAFTITILSSDSDTFGDPVMKGTLEAGIDEQLVSLTVPATGRYFKFVALIGHQSQTYASVSEFNRPCRTKVKLFAY